MSHELADRVSLELGRRAADRLRQQPALIEVARQNLHRWSQRNADVPSLLQCYSEWRGILERPLPEICELLVSDHEEGRRLRQNSPFAGLLSPREVWEVKRSFRHAQAAA